MNLWLGARPFVVALSLSYLTAGIGGALTDLGPWYFSLKQPGWKPPDAAFGIIWTTIFTLTAVSAALAWREAVHIRARVWWLFGLNALLNILWSALYFKLQRPDWAMLEWCLLWLSVLSLVLGFWKSSRWTTYLNLPYLLWVSVAGLLNLAALELNGPFSGAVG